MYLFRVVPNSFMCRKNKNDYSIGINQKGFMGAEEIYYDLGYTPFVLENNSQKSFFLSLDDALKYSQYVINTGSKEGYISNILVYNFPMDIALENIGYGRYKDYEKEIIVDVVETKIGNEKFGNTFDSSIIPQSAIFNALYKSFNNSMTNAGGIFSEYDFTSFDYVLYIQTVCEKKGLGKSNTDLVVGDMFSGSNNEYLKDIVKDSILFKNIINNNCTISKCAFNTGINIIAMSNGTGTIKINNTIQPLTPDIIEKYSLDEHTKHELLYGIIEDNNQDQYKKILMR